MMNRRLSFATLAALAALPLAAQQPPAVNLDMELDEIVNTDQIQAASKRVQDVASAPADVVVLRGSELRALGYRTLGDALGGVVGFRTNEDHAYQGIGLAGAYALGDQNTRMLVLLDGHALNSPAEVGSSKVGEDFGLPMELVDHIEIVRGPASSLYGNNAFQALVNVSTVFASGSVPGAFQAAATGGSGGLGELWTQGTLNFKGVAASLMLSGFRRAGTAQTYPQQVDPATGAAYPQPLPAGADREDRQSAYLYLKGGEWSFAGAMLSRTQLLASAPYAMVPGDPGNSYRNQRLSGEFKWEPRTASVRWLFRLFGDRNTFSDSFIDGTRPVPDVHQTDEDPDRGLGLEVQGRAAITERFSLTFGTELQYHRYGGIFRTSENGSSVGTDVAFGTGNTYLEANWQPLASLGLVAGLQRADWRPSHLRNDLDGTRQDLERQSMIRYTPRLSVIWKPQAGDVAKLVFGQGFRFPTIFERYYTDASDLAANTALKPEVITSGQLSWTRKWSPAFTSHLAAAVLSSQHAIFSGIEAGGLSQYQNAPDAKQGRTAELELAWRHSGTELSGGAGYYHWTYQGLPLDNTSEWNAVFKAIRHLGSVSVAGEARYVGARRTVDTQVPANWTLRASVRWEGRNVWAQASCEDATNSRRRDLVAPEYAPITWMAADGRAVRTVLGVRF